MRKTFIHIPKTGGSALKKSNFDFDDTDTHLKLTQAYIKFANFHSIKNFHSGHRPIITIHPDEFKLREFFTIIRNPWSRYVSYYNFYKNYTKSFNPSSFKKFLTNKIEAETRFISDFANQKDWATYIDGTMINILRQEHLNEDANIYFNKSKKISKFNITSDNSLSYIDYYDDKLISLVAEYNKIDIEYFGFLFKGSATCNTYCT